MKKSRILLTAMISCTLWASAFPAVKLLFTELGIGSDASAKIALAGMRFFTAGLLILVTSYIMNKKAPLPEKSQWGNLFLVGMFQTAGLYSLYYVSIAFVTGVKAAVLSQGGVFYMIILAYLFLGERVKRKHLFGIFWGLIGIIVLNIASIGNDAQLFSMSFQGEGLLLMSGVFGSIGQILAKKRCTGMPPMTLNGWQMTFGGGALLIAGVIMNGGIVPLTSGFGIFLMLYSIMVAAVGFTVWYSLLQKVNINDIVPYRLTIPVLGSIFSAIILPGESITVNIIFGLVFVVIGMYVISVPEKRAM